MLLVALCVGGSDSSQMTNLLPSWVAKRRMQSRSSNSWLKSSLHLICTPLIVRLYLLKVRMANPLRGIKNHQRGPFDRVALVVLAFSVVGLDPNRSDRKDQVGVREGESVSNER